MTVGTFTAFLGDQRLAAGSEAEIAATLRALGSAPSAAILVFDDETGRQTDLDLRAAPPAGPKGRGRPSLGVVAREVTLLPRHWDWLARQPEGASAALRRLVDAARADAPANHRAAMTAAYEFMKAMAGDRPNYEEALRALFAADRPRFEMLIADWPAAVRDYALRLAYGATT